MPKYNDYPLNELAVTMQRAIAKGAQVYQKFTCGYCGARQTIEEPNALFIDGKCEECKSVTNLAKAGGNLLIVQPLRKRNNT